MAIVPVTTSVVTIPKRNPSEAPLTGGVGSGVEVEREWVVIASLMDNLRPCSGTLVYSRRGISQNCLALRERSDAFST
jgi:hypothetical protein